MTDIERPAIFAPTLGRNRSLRRKNSRDISTLQRKQNLFEKPKERPSLWVLFSWGATCCFPAPLLKTFGVPLGSQQAWREKFALCAISGVLMVSLLFFLLFFSNLLCPSSLTNNSIPVNTFGGVVIFGDMYESSTMSAPYNSLFEQTDASFGGIDVTSVFKRPPVPACDRPEPAKYKMSQLISPCEPDNCLDLDELINVRGLRKFTNLLVNQGNKNNTVSLNPSPAYEWKDVRQRGLVAYQNKVLNFEAYFEQNPVEIKNDPVDRLMRLAQQINDATHLIEQSEVVVGDVKECLIKKYEAGILSVLPMSCVLSRVFTYVISATILAIIFAKFVMSLVFDWFLSSKLARNPPADKINSIYLRTQSTKPLLFNDNTLINNRSLINDGRQRGVALTMSQVDSRSPKPHPADLFTVLLVTCYSEGETSIRNTLDSLAATSYDDSKKLLFVIADGLVKGSDNDLSTPEILIRMMVHDPRFGSKPTTQSYEAVGSGSKQHNMAQVYCGCYLFEGRAVPMILVVKCGTPEEKTTAKPGNRGKRDSQIILMNFFSRITLNDRMTPLDYDIFRKIHHICGVTPDFFELVLMVDADTVVNHASLRYLVNATQNDPTIMGLCGETRIENKAQSWVTMIQVFEYFISHQMGKAFESVFGGVTCLPGCFSMWRLKSEDEDGMIRPILGNPDIIEQYRTNEVFTLHQKNLLLLGEDRFLSTIMLRQFPKRKTVYVPQAFCRTVVPDDFKTLLSQRRRWINSTIHNLMELVLVNTLCGTFCFSMQFIVFMDLLSTAVMPAGLGATYYLIVSTILNFEVIKDSVVSKVLTIVMIIVIFLPAVLVILTGRRFNYVGWMLLYLLTLPVWQIVLPLYAFWNFDDFSWGETRKVSGDTATKDGHGGDDNQQVLAQIPYRRWDEYEREWRKSMRSNSQMAAN